MSKLPPIARWATAFAVLAGSAGACRATEVPAYAPVQTEREVSFLTVGLGLKDEIAAMQQHSPQPLRIEYAMLDLDADGHGELFVRFFAGQDCVPGACTTIIFNNADGRWVTVLKASNAEVTVAKQVHRGYRDILVGSQPWIWGGKAFVPAR
jgi:hypothetical protein